MGSKWQLTPMIWAPEEQMEMINAISDNTADLNVNRGIDFHAGPIKYVPAFTSLTAHSAAETPCMSPSGPMHMEAATGFPLVFST